MVESHLNAGAQKFAPARTIRRKLEYGKSITDACIGWDDSLAALQMLSDAVTARRAVALRRLGLSTDERVRSKPGARPRSRDRRRGAGRAMSAALRVDQRDGGTELGDVGRLGRSAAWRACAAAPNSRLSAHTKVMNNPTPAMAKTTSNAPFTHGFVIAAKATAAATAASRARRRPTAPNMPPIASA